MIAAVCIHSCVLMHFFFPNIFAVVVVLAVAAKQSTKWAECTSKH